MTTNNPEYRQFCNIQILEILKQIATMHPSLRFGQILMISKVIESENLVDDQGNINVKIKDIFNEESQTTLERLITEIKKGGTLL